MSDLLVQKINIVDAYQRDGGFRPLLKEVSSQPELEEEGLAENDTPDLFDAGYLEGQRAATDAFELERDHYRRLIASAEALQSEPSEELAVLIGEAVERMVSEVVGKAAIDRDWLNHHARRAADLVAECDAARTMWLHPDDLPLIDSSLISLTLVADPDAERGSIRIDCSAGWIEHGTALYLDELRTELGLKGLEA
ncbi:MAG: flagellar biosynthetic protein [Pseudomonadota bacterium]